MAQSTAEISVDGRDAPIVHKTDILADLADYVGFCGTKHKVTAVKLTLNLIADSDAAAAGKIVAEAGKALAAGKPHAPVKA